MKLFLAIVVVLAQVAGPWLCCCAPARLLAGEFPPAKSVPVSETKEPVCHSCCQHLQDQLAGQSSEEPNSPTAPEPCPCGGISFETVPIIFVDKDAEQRPVKSQPQFHPLWLSQIPPGKCVSHPNHIPGLRELPNLSTNDKLFAHHVLIC